MMIQKEKSKTIYKQINFKRNSLNIEIVNKNIKI